MRGLSHYHYWPNTAKRPHTANMSWAALTCLIVSELKGRESRLKVKGCVNRRFGSLNDNAEGEKIKSLSEE